MRNQRIRSRRQRRGFTLMEVLLVLAILVILGALVGVAYTRVRQNSYEQAAGVQINMLKTSLDLYENDFGRFPDNLEDLRKRPTGTDGDRWKGPYLDEEIPQDPWGRAYQYEQVQDEYGNPTYQITSLGIDGQPGNDDISNRPTK